MAERYLITQTLLSAWGYMFDCHEDVETDARESFLRTLRREPTVTTPEMQNGIDFENLCYSIANGTFRPEWRDAHAVNSVSGESMEYYKYPKNYAGAKLVASRIRGAQIQVRVSRELTVDGMDFVVYGILDALKAGTISDVKFKNEPFGKLELAGSYRESPQHSLYFYLVPEALDFQYLVSDGEELYTEIYHPNECRSAAEIIHNYLQWLIGAGLLELYKKYWVAR